MNEPQDNLIAYLTTLQHSWSSALKRLPLKSRAAQGVLMAIRVVSGAGLAYGIGLALHTQQAFWAAITAIAVSQQNYSDMLSQSRDQVIGAAAGGVCGFAAATFGAGNLGAYLVALAVVIVGCWLLKVGTAARLGGITTTIVMLVPAQGPAWDIALVRFAEVTIGMACALPVGWLVSYAERRWLEAVGALPTSGK
ncbi:FUSC family protein [Paraburkholderia caballeronis]|uniref:Fusaric acid resistance protein-like n=1 Tax=Paraburkholderia caballeronis TaxID=416943 RepID=A0A1H7QN21_9BURK|nr:FUSC family protein [Paraburkholderia caballeronis]PXW22455.1 fusaric acid resistance family protein [Paraburkholderia caballeronis]PXW96326.1 fusaric acid resistance family protein [Paraburkholderia caballeronis]RAJ92737.1 fusaric acid resistance family protein [Paraburkholderia caballeronis]TDV15104.1 fusaric acid resistance family protein [Paraburkholderia caballeronis]TDV16771.1 fusaric acid resistance family protein [Paraburkholderia caballeronis]